MKRKVPKINKDLLSKKRKLPIEESENSSEDISDSDGDESDYSASGEIEESSSERANGDEPRNKKAKGSIYAELPKINNLKETENLYHSNLFRLQNEELLQEMRLSAEKKIKIEDYIRDFISSMKRIKESPSFELSNEEWKQKLGVKIPIVNSKSDCKVTWKFVPPKDVEPIGSFSHGLTVSKKFSVDIMFNLPKDSFMRSDFLNMRYLRKRAYYLAHLASQLQNLDLVDNVSYKALNGNMLAPILKVKPSGTLGKRITLNIIPSLSTCSFKLSRFIPQQNNLRTSWFDEELFSDCEPPPTPLYNALMLRETSYAKIHEFIQTSLSSHQKIKDGIILLKIWLHQRSLDKGDGGFSGFILTMFVLYLLKKRKLSGLMSCYQVARTTWLALCGSDWPENGITFMDSEGLESISGSYEVTFLDPSGNLNLCSDMRKETLLRVKHEASLAVEYLNAHHLNSFDYLFMAPVNFNKKFDVILKLSNLDKLKTICQSAEIRNKFLDSCGNVKVAMTRQIINIINKAIGSRITLLDIKVEDNLEWDVNQEIEDVARSNDNITFGLLLNPSTFCEVLIKGPDGNDPEAEEFRDFWGNKSELRRFQDSSICEAVVWPGSSIAEKRNITELIINYVFSRHLSIDENSISYMCNQMDSVINLPKISPPDNITSYGTGEEANFAILQSFDILNSSLRKLDGLPLHITTIQGISPAFRYAKVFPSLPVSYSDENFDAFNDCLVFSEDLKKIPKHVEPLKVLIQLEGSGKWPDDLKALQRIKAAFYLRLAKLINKQCFLSTYPSSQYVDVYKDGYVFRLVISCQKEIVLMKTVTTPNEMKLMRDTPESLALENEIVALPKLTSTLHGLQKFYPAFSATVRMAKRWINSQLLGDHIPELAIELIVSHIFLQPAPYTTPNVPMIAFQRFLNFLSTHDWKSTPLIVNLGDEFTGADYSQIQSSFDKSRSTLPHMFISSPFDRMSHFTKYSPTVLILCRLILLAKEAISLINEPSYNFDSQLNILKLFKPALKSYDVIIHLKPNMVPNYYHHLESKSHKVKFSFNNKIQGKIPITDFNPVEMYLKELREAYGEIALFFNDKLGGDIIAVLFKPTTKVREEYKFTNAEFKILHKDEKKMSVNFEAVIEDFLNVGRGLVKNIETDIVDI